jgi:acetyl/propionyl-CoA carboxylase alpha subunit
MPTVRFERRQRAAFTAEADAGRAGGEPILTLDAMKLEMPVPAPVSGTILSVHLAPGDQLGLGRVLAVIGAAA